MNYKLAWEMKNKFTKAMEYYNSLISQVEYGSKEYRLLVLAQHRYIIDF